jgi:hypothetical protein
MLVKNLLPAFVAVGSAVAQSKTCTVSTTTVNSQADATKLADCKVVKGSIVFSNMTGAVVDISGPEEITGDITVIDHQAIQSFKSSTLEKVGGEFRMNNVQILRDVQFPELKEAKKVSIQSAPTLGSLIFGPLTKADEVTISDTQLTALDAIDVATLNKLDINNNRRLEKFATQLKSLSDVMNIHANGILGLGLSVDMPNLVWIANMTIANVTEFDVPSLKVVNGSARFDFNFFESFSAPNLTHTEDGDISFVGNGALTNMTFPKLTEVGGGLTIANNTGLDRVTFFPKLEHVYGAVKLRGNFTEVEFPSLDSVDGAFDVSSTADIEKSCDELKKKKSNGDIQVTFSCTANNENANEDTDSAGSGSSGSDKDENSASGVAFNTALFALVAVAALASAL